MRGKRSVLSMEQKSGGYPSLNTSGTRKAPKCRAEKKQGRDEISDQWGDAIHLLRRRMTASKGTLAHDTTGSSIEHPLFFVFQKKNVVTGAQPRTNILMQQIFCPFPYSLFIYHYVLILAFAIDCLRLLSMGLAL